MIRDSIAYTDHAKRKTVTALDVVYALKRSGRSLVTSPSRREGLVQNVKLWQGSRDRARRRSLQPFAERKARVNFFSASALICSQEENGDFSSKSEWILVILGAFDSYSRAGGHCVVGLTRWTRFFFYNVHSTHS